MPDDITGTPLEKVREPSGGGSLCNNEYCNVLWTDTLHFQCTQAGVDIYLKLFELLTAPNGGDRPTPPFTVIVSNPDDESCPLQTQFRMHVIVEEEDGPCRQGADIECVPKMVEQATPIHINVMGGGLTKMAIDIQLA